MRNAAGNVNIVVAPEAMADRVTLAVRNMAWRTALAEIATRAKCTVEEHPRYLRVARSPQATLEVLKLQVGKCRLDGETCRKEDQAKDFLRMAVARRRFRMDLAELEVKMGGWVSKNSPGFRSADLQDRYLVEVKGPYERLLQDFADLRDAK